jgi:glucose-1-phosphate thymidylyltransferase
LGSAHVAYAVQPEPRGLCDAVFRALPLIQPSETVTIGLPDTICFPEDGLAVLPDDRLSLLLFPVDHPELFDAVVTAPDGRVLEIQVKRQQPGSSWIWGAFRMPGAILHELYALWWEREQRDECLGTLINAYRPWGGRPAGCALARPMSTWAR